MANSIYAHYPPPLLPEQEAYLVQEIKNWSIQHGLAVRPSPAFISNQADPATVLATTAPVTLFPSPFPKSCFVHATELQVVYNELYAAIASDEDWLEEIMKELIEVDDFIAKLWRVHLEVKKEGYVQPLSLGLFRSDYMLHCPPSSARPSLKQVEFNTISSSFGGLATLVSSLHTHLINFPTPSAHLAYPPHPLFRPLPGENSHDRASANIPPSNNAVETLCSGLSAAFHAYGYSKSSPPMPLCILFLVQDHERNLFDQLALSNRLHKHHRIPTFRLPVSQILSQTSMPPYNPYRPLVYSPPSSPTSPFEAAVVYFRALYAPTEYDSSTSWSARLHLERSAAIKCPTVLTHLAGSKKVQQVLTSTDPNHLAHFFPQHQRRHRRHHHSSDNTSTSSSHHHHHHHHHSQPSSPTSPTSSFSPPAGPSPLRDTFAPQYSLSPLTEEGQEGARLAMNPTTAAHHVLKPQREGGGNNIYRTDIPEFLQTIPQKDWGQYILMELIQPPADATNTVLRSDGSIASGNVISELGIFGACLWSSVSSSTSKEDPNTTSTSSAEDDAQDSPTEDTASLRSASTTTAGWYASQQQTQQQQQQQQQRRRHKKRSRPKVHILHNDQGGYLLRTKAKDSDEGGVAAGFSSLDSLLLYEDGMTE